MTDEEKMTLLAGWLLDQRAAYPAEGIDGGDLQDALEKYGFLGEFKATEPCFDNCECAEFGFPSSCYRQTGLGTQVRRAYQAMEKASRS